MPRNLEPRGRSCPAGRLTVRDIGACTNIYFVLGWDSPSTLNCESRAAGGTLTERSRVSLLATPAAMVVNLLVREQTTSSRP
jgi:hypothetical protein